MRALPIFIVIGLGLITGPAWAGDQAARAATETVLAFKSERAAPLQSVPLAEQVACKADGAPCTGDTTCCSGACRPAGEGQACVAKTAATDKPGTPSQPMPAPGSNSSNMDVPAGSDHANPQPKAQ